MNHCTYPNCDKEIGPRRTVCRRHQNKLRNDRNRRAAIDYLGGKCVGCETTENLQFDHTDRETMLFRISQFLGMNFEELKIELDKCQLLCTDCHKKKTREELVEAGLWDKEIPHGTVNGYMNYSCRCADCRDAWNEYQKLKQYRKKKL